MGFEHCQWVWMNGKCVPWSNATAHVSAHGLHYGSGVFEGLRCYNTSDGPAVFRMDAHLKRLYSSAETYGIKIPFSTGELSQAISETIRRNGFQDCYVRPIVYLGSSSLSLHPRQCPVEVVILAWPWGAYLGDEAVERGARITVSPWRKFDSQMMPTRAKACGQYLNSILAVQDAVARGFDEALLLNQDGTIAEGSGENIFLVKDGVVITNSSSDGILPGVTRDCVLEMVHDLGWKVEVRPVGLTDLLQSDEAFFTGTAAEVVPIAEVDGSKIGTGRRGAKTGLLQHAFAEATSGRNARYRHWLHFVQGSKPPELTQSKVLPDSPAQTNGSELTT
jgi:branched-chain amino acid aminotransferase